MTITGAGADQTTAPTATDHRPATRSPGGDAAAVLATLRSDWIKASTVRVNRALLLLALVGGLAVSWAVATFVTDGPGGGGTEVLVISEVGFYWTSVTSMLAAVGG
ncbi:MAG TPA: hypothetical protein VJ352_16490, partial [Geodermatophilus sp.]|nr:hypothetical protein [Geodermatophilus sp.]